MQQGHKDKVLRMDLDVLLDQFPVKHARGIALINVFEDKE